MSLAPAGTAPKMTLRRFVRVTLDNFRQLLQTIAAPTTVLPMPDLTKAMETDTFGGDTLGTDILGAGAPSAATVDEEAAGQEPPEQESAGQEIFGGELPGIPVDDEDGGLPEPAQAQAVSGAVSGAVPAMASLSLAAALESLLFVSDEAVEPAHLARALGCDPGEVEAGLQTLDAAYRAEGRGLRLQTRNGRYQLVTAPEAANLIEIFLNLDTSARLSAPALETLAVVAYRQPVTRAQIEAVRGVDCSGVLRSLLQRGLLEEVGRLDAPGRPVLYGVTDLFMHHFGLTALHELPPLETAEIARIEDALAQES